MNQLGRSWKSHLDSHFPNSPPIPRRLFLDSLVVFRSQFPMQLKGSGTIIKQGWRQARWGRLQGARQRQTHAAHPGASGLPRSGLAAAGWKEVRAAARLLAGSCAGGLCHQTQTPTTLSKSPQTAPLCSARPQRPLRPGIAARCPS